MKKSLQKLILVVMVTIIIFNVFFPMISCATVDSSSDELWDSMQNTAFDALDGIVGILTWVLRAPVAAIVVVIQGVLSQLCGIGEFVTAEDIIFTGSSRESQTDTLNINFFDFSGNGAEDSVVLSFREGVAKWYYALRNLSIVASLAVLIYVGIRMAISSVASDKARYKQMLKDWIVGFAVLFSLHYIIVMIISLNNELVDLIFQFKSNTNSSIWADYNTSLLLASFNPVNGFVEGVGSLLIYAILVGTTCALFIMYLKRLFTVGFLIVISPLITVTYAIDKIGDGRSQALNTWLKEFSYNVLIQPFHCIIYMVFVSGAMDTLSSSPSLKSLIFSVIGVLFIFKAEDIVKKIFGFEASSLEGVATAGALAAGVVQKAQGMRQKATGKVEGGKGTSSSGGSSGIKRKSVPSNTSGNTNTNSSSAGNSNSGSTGARDTAVNNAVKKSSNGAFSKVGEAISNSAFGKAVSEYKEEKVEGFNALKSDPKGTIGKAVKSGVLKATSASMKIAPKVATGAMVAGMTGNGLTGIATGYVVPGGKLTRKLSGYADEDLHKMQQRNDEARLANAYENYRIANPDMSDEELYNKCADLMEVDPDTLTDPGEIKLAKQLRNMQAVYEANGEGKPDVKVMNKVEDIQLGDVKSTVSVKSKAIGEAVKRLQQENPKYDNKKVIELSNKVINDEDYSKSDEYKKLEKPEKNLVKEINRSKKMLKAIGNSSNENINKEVEKAVQKALNGKNK